MPGPAARPYVPLIVSREVVDLEEATPASKEGAPGRDAALVDRGVEVYVARCRKKIPAFVSDNFSLRQTWDLQRPTLWLDLACAPVNAAWALPHLAAVKVAETSERVGYPKLSRWAKRLPAGIKTGYQRRIERRICTELLEWDRDQPPARLPQGYLKELEATPALRTRIEALEPERSHGASERSLTELLQQFSAGRAIVSDLLGTLLALATSWALLGSASMSLTGIAHGIAKKGAHDRAASRFFLGKKVGSVFYNVFPPEVHQSTVWMILVFLVIGLTIGAAACTILSDPVRKALGFHRHRLDALVDDVERELIVLSHKGLRPKQQA